MFLMLTLYMQQVLLFSPLKTGVGYIAVAGTAIIWANVAAQAVTRVGVKPTLAVGTWQITYNATTIVLSFPAPSARKKPWRGTDCST